MPSGRGSRTVPPATGTRKLAWVVLVASLLEVAAPLVISIPGSSPAPGSGPDLLITPVGWAFSIWGVIYTLAIAQAVAVLLTGAERVPRRLQIAQIVLYLTGALWIGLAALDSSVATAAALTVMLVAGVDAVLTVARRPLPPRWFALLSRAAVGLFAGWVTAAFFLNLSIALVDLGVRRVDDLLWQLVVLVVALIVLLTVLIAARGILPYAAAGAWALVGITVTGVQNGNATVTFVALAAAILVVASAAALRLSGRHPVRATSGPDATDPAQPAATTVSR